MIRYEGRERCGFCGEETEAWDKGFCQKCNVRWGIEDDTGVVSVEVWSYRANGKPGWWWRIVPAGCMLVLEKWSKEV